MIDELMREIAERFSDGGDWCSLEKAQTLAAIVVGLRPRLVCEIGVWMGGSLVPMAMGLRALDHLDRAQGREPVARRVVGVDPWSAQESCAGQAEVDKSWWGTVDHEAAMLVFLARLERHGLREYCEVVRCSSDDAIVPPSIDLLHVDGNHAEQATRDVARFAPRVPAGGILVLDDLSWAGDHVRRAQDLARELGFCTLYPLGTGVVMQRERGPI